MVRMTVVFLAAAEALTFGGSTCAAPIHFDDLVRVATTPKLGIPMAEGFPNWMAGYEGKIYFNVFKGYSEPGATIWRYDPARPSSNVEDFLTTTVGCFGMLRVIGRLLYVSDTSGRLWTYDGSSLRPETDTPFEAGDFVAAAAVSGEHLYFATMSGRVYRRNDDQSYSVVLERLGHRISDMVLWPKNGCLYVSFTGQNLASDGFVLKSRGSDDSQWDVVIRDVFRGADHFVVAPQYLYAAVRNSAYCYGSSIRRTGDGETFSVISQSNGEYKQLWGGLFHDGFAYFFVDRSGTGMGYVISDDGVSTEMVANQKWHVGQAVELDGEVYATAMDNGVWSVPSTVYLLSSPCVKAIVDLAPDTLNLRSGGQYVTCHITLPAGYDPSQIDASTVKITRVDGEESDGLPVPIDPSFAPAIEDYDEDGILDLTVKFSRQRVVDIPLQAGERRITVEGRLGLGRAFKGEDVMRVIDRGK